MPEHISRKELKQDKIKETLEHGAEAVYSHGQFTLAVLLVVLVAAAAYGGWRIYNDRKTVEASAAFDVGAKNLRRQSWAAPYRVNQWIPASRPIRMRIRGRRTRRANSRKSPTNIPAPSPGKWARYYNALCLEDLQQFNQALEELKKISSGGDKELADMAQYQTAIIYNRTGKPDDAIAILRTLADKGSVFVPRPLVLLTLAGALRQTKPQEAATVYQQIKKEFPDSTISEEADRGLGTISPNS